jgi:Ecdysteroid kinase-like family
MSHKNVSSVSFVSSEYMKILLQKYFKNSSIRIESIKVQPFGSAGDGYASSMYSIEVNVSGFGDKIKKGFYILKMLPLTDLACEKLGDYNAHEKEMEIFEKILPEIKKLLKAVDEDKNLFPKAVAVDRIRNALIFEDLSVRGFIMEDRTMGLNLEQMKLSISKLARMHAASMVLLEKNSETFKNFKHGMFSREITAFHNFFGSHLDSLTDEVSQWNGYEKYAEKLGNMKKVMFEKAFKCFDNEPGDLKTLIHGDLWINNLLFKYHKRSISDVIIVSILIPKKLSFSSPCTIILLLQFLQLDFQFCCIAHPAIDLLYFIFTSSIDEVRQSKVMHLTQHYYYELKFVLKRLNYNFETFPSLQEFQLQIMKKFFYCEINFLKTKTFSIN